MMRLPAAAALLVAAGIAAGCASYSGSALRAGQSSMDDVLSTMGPPAMRWTRPDGGAQLSYPRGPEGVHSFMVWVGPGGRLERIENALVPEQFARIVEGMAADDVLKVLGPPVPHWIADFPVRRERAWQWRICYRFNPARFGVLMDADTLVVRSTFIDFDIQGPEGTPICTL